MYYDFLCTDIGLQQPENTGGLTNIFERPLHVPHTREWSLLKTPIFWIQHTLIHDLNLPYHMLQSHQSILCSFL